MSQIMEKFYSNQFVLWRPQLLLLLLISLGAVLGCIGRGGGKSVWRGTGGYKSYCRDDSSCRNELVCDSFRKICICRNFVSDKLALVYDWKVDRCMSAVGKLCTLDVRVVGDDGLPRLDCVRHAECARPVGVQLASHFGICQCQPGWEESEEHLCRGSGGIRVADGDRDPISTSSAPKEVGPEGGLPQEGVPIEEGKEDMMSTTTEGNIEILGGDNKVNDSRIPVKVVVTSPAPESPNENEGIEVPKAVLEGWEDFDPLKKSSSRANNGGSSNTKTKPIVALIVLLHAFAFSFLG